MVDTAREVGGQNPKNVWWNDVVKVDLKEKGLHGRRYRELGMRLQKTDVWIFTRKKKEVKRCIYIKEQKR